MPRWDEDQAAARIAAHFQRSADVARMTLEAGGAAVLARMAVSMVMCLGAGGKLMLCGNGGSAADAQHLAAELLIRLRSTVNRIPLPAITLATDTSTLTACGNDYGFEEVFVRPLLALGRPGDLLLVLTTSGRSPNVVRALAAARGRGIGTLGFLGGAGTPALGHCDLAFLVPSTDTAHIQETHITAGHILMEMVEDAFRGAGDSSSRSEG